MPLPSLKGTIALSWGPSGGFYVHPRRICLGRLALTFTPDVEIDDLMEAYVERDEITRALELAYDVYTPEGVGIWLHGRKRTLDGERPIDLLKSGRAREVVAQLDAMASGAFV